jgi:hypothetical protein
MVNQAYLSVIITLIGWVLRPMPKGVDSILGSNARWDEILLPDFAYNTLLRQRCARTLSLKT